MIADARLSVTARCVICLRDVGRGLCDYMVRSFTGRLFRGGFIFISVSSSSATSTILRLPARRYGSAVCAIDTVSVRLSVRHKARLPSSYFTLCCKEIRNLQSNGTFLWNLVLSGAAREGEGRHAPPTKLGSQENSRLRR